jgi:hypothetical protein
MNIATGEKRILAKRLWDSDSESSIFFGFSGELEVEKARFNRESKSFSLSRNLSSRNRIPIKHTL